MKSFLVLAFVGGLTIQTLAAEKNIYISLTCKGSEEVHDPQCRGTNSRRLKIVSPAYRESRFYGGCFPFGDTGFGAIEEVSKSGDTVTFLLRRQGAIHSDIPFYDPNSSETMQGTYNISTKELILDTSEVLWPFQRPKKLDCEGRVGR